MRLGILLIFMGLCLALTGYPFTDAVETLTGAYIDQPTKSSSVCKLSESYLSDDDINKFVRMTQINIVTLEDAYKDAKALVDDIENEVKKACDLFGNYASDCKKRVRATTNVAFATADLALQVGKGASKYYNNFLLGTVCLAANPQEYYKDNAYKLKGGIFDDLEDTCFDIIDYLTEYAVTVAKQFNSYDANINISGIRNAMKDLKNSGLCTSLSDALSFSQNTINNMINELEKEASAIIKKYYPSFSSFSEMSDAYDLVLKTLEPNEYVILDTNNNIVKDNSGYDASRAAKDNPRYKELVTDMSPSTGNLKNINGGGMSISVTALVFIILLVALIVAIGVSLAVGCTHLHKMGASSGKKEKKEEGEKDVSVKVE